MHPGHLLAAGLLLSWTQSLRWLAQILQGVTQQPWGSTPILLTGWLQAVETSFCFPHSICSMWSWMCLTPIFVIHITS